MAGEDLGDGTEGVLADGGEDGGAGEVPQLFGLGDELSGEVSGAGDRSDVIGLRREDCRVWCRREKWLLSLAVVVSHGDIISHREK